MKERDIEGWEGQRMLTFVFAGMETALHMGILAGAFFALYGKEEYKRGKRTGIWLWFVLLCVVEVLRRLFAAGSLDSVWFLGVLEGCWLWSYGRGRGTSALVWGIFPALYGASASCACADYGRRAGAAMECLRPGDTYPQCAGRSGQPGDFCPLFSPVLLAAKETPGAASVHAGAFRIAFPAGGVTGILPLLVSYQYGARS